MVLDKLKCRRHHTIVESDLTAKHLEWQIAKKKKIKDKDYILTHPFCHSTVRKIVLMKGVKQSRRVSCREKKKRYFFLIFILKNKPSSFLYILSDVYFVWLFCLSSSFFNIHRSLLHIPPFHINNTKSRENNNDIKNNNIFLYFICMHH